MTARQMALHQEFAEIVSKIASSWRRKGFLTEAEQRRLMIALQNMRMVCNSTYLIDQDTDEGVKADELMTLIDEAAGQSVGDGDALNAQTNKIVVFSQWTRTHEIIGRRLRNKGVDFVSFHGGVVAEKRATLLEQFRDDPQCRVFFIERCRQHRIESATRHVAGQYGFTVESSDTGTADRTHSSHGVKESSADCQLCRQGND